MSKYGRVTAELKDIPDDEPVFVIRGKDVLAPRAIDAYANLLMAARDGADDEITRLHLEEMARNVSSVATDIAMWQTVHPDLVRLPD